MFDVGFWELVVIGIVALLVLGPERLPVVARTAGLWYGKVRHFVGTVKADIDRELKAEELKRIVQEQTKSEGLYNMVEEAKSSLQEIKSGLEDVNRSVDLASLGTSSDTAPSSTPSVQPDNDKRHE